jgi:hypothetical protein
MKSGNLNFLEPSGPLQACNGSALPYTVTADTEDYLQKAAHKLNKIITGYGLTISVQKTKSLAFKGRDPVGTKTVIHNKA